MLPERSSAVRCVDCRSNSSHAYTKDLDLESALARAASSKEMTCNLRLPLSFCVPLCCLQSCDGGASTSVAGACVGESSMSWQSTSMSLLGVCKCVKDGILLFCIKVRDLNRPVLGCSQCRRLCRVKCMRTEAYTIDCSWDLAALRGLAQHRIALSAHRAASVSRKLAAQAFPVFAVPPRPCRALDHAHDVCAWGIEEGICTSGTDTQLAYRTLIDTQSDRDICNALCACRSLRTCWLTRMQDFPHNYPQKQDRASSSR